MQRILQRIGALFRGGPEPVILMYHRIAEPPYDPWGLAVTPRKDRKSTRLNSSHSH